MNEALSKELNKARALKDIGNYSGSIDAYKTAISIQPGSFELIQELAITLWQQGLLDEALEYSEQLIRLNSKNPNGFTLCGHINLEKNNLDTSIAAYETAINLYNNHAEIYSSLALALKEKSRFKEAFDSYNKSLSLDPDNPEIHFNRSILSLLTGDYSSGFKEYEWRKQKKERYGNRALAQPHWQGEDLKGKTLLVHHEQGLGDAIQFSRYIRLLNNCGGTVLYAAHPPLMQLLSSMGDVNFTDASDASLKYDYHCPLLSLPLIMGTTVEKIPAETPYLFAQTERISKWKQRIGADGFKIGIAWQGSAGRFATNRLFSLSHLKCLSNIPNIRLIGLHKEPLHNPWQLPEEVPIESLGPGFDADTDAFLDCAAAVECCDLIISCDTAIAHLAGAMGKPTWIILRHVPHWIWMMDRDDSPWYPTVRLFRQKQPGDWSGPFNKVASELTILLSSTNKHGLE